MLFVSAVPGAPGQPHAIDTSDDHITLTWTKPYKDGGSPIQGYTVEKREKGDKKWTKAAFGLVPGLTHKVTGLTPNKCYEFRVCAVNAAGPGPFSENSEPIYARIAPCAPRIDMSMLVKDILAFVGDPVKITVPFIASPPPTITWSKGDDEIQPSDRIFPENGDYVTVLQNKKCERGDSGQYTISLSNELGSDSATVRVTVVDRPSPPEGPLLIGEITPDSCVLTWMSPKDDGGSPVTNYIVEKCNTKYPDRWEKVSSFVRTTHYEVMDLVEGNEYKFRVRAENQYGVSDPLESDKPIVAKYQFGKSIPIEAIQTLTSCCSLPSIDVPGPPGAPVPDDMDTTWVHLSWDRPETDGGSKIIGYHVEFRDPASHRWVQANPHPCKDTNFKVEGLRDRGEYEFRVLAKNAAGLSKPSPTSGIIKLKPKYGPPGPPGMPSAESIGKNHITLTWKPPLSDGGSKITGEVLMVCA